FFISSSLLLLLSVCELRSWLYDPIGRPRARWPPRSVRTALRRDHPVRLSESQPGAAANERDRTTGEKEDESGCRCRADCRVAPDEPALGRSYRRSCYLVRQGGVQLGVARLVAVVLRLVVREARRQLGIARF